MQTDPNDLDTALCVLAGLIAQQLPHPEQLRDGLLAAAEELVADRQGASVLMSRLAGFI